MIIRSEKSRWPGLSALLLTFAQCSGAVAAATPAERPEIFDTGYLVQVFGSLLFVFACLFGLAFLFKKINGVPMIDRKSIQVLGSVKVGSREKILLVNAGNQQLLLGVATGSVRTLHVFDAPLEGQTQDRAGAPGDFASVLKTSGAARAKR